ncbi:MAG: hypothetical protein RLZ37_39 [Actinomycetota bacterium]|jgi:hypothetical protein
MNFPGLLIAVGAITLASCGGSSTTASTEVAQSLPAGGAAPDSPSAPVETLPALLDPSTDIEAIDSPVVLWFWSPG